MKFNGVICHFEINVVDISRIKQQAKNFVLFYSFSFIKKKKNDQMACDTLKLRWYKKS